jgi:hypothetical protein
VVPIPTETDSNAENAMHAALCEEEITERSKLPRPLVERISDDLSRSGIVRVHGVGCLVFKGFRKIRRW